MSWGFTNTEKATEARREAKMRKMVYERRGFTELDLRRIAMMEEIAADYEQLAEKERLL